MFSMTVVFGASPVQWTLLFKTKDSWDQARTVYNTAPSGFDGSMFEVIDDYGQQLIVARAHITGVLFEDMSKSKMAHIDRSLHQMHIQIEGDAMASADPAIANARRTMQQRNSPPGVITPFGPNVSFRQ